MTTKAKDSKLAREPYVFKTSSKEGAANVIVNLNKSNYSALLSDLGYSAATDTTKGKKMSISTAIRQGYLFKVRISYRESGRDKKGNIYVPLPKLEDVMNGSLEGAAYSGGKIIDVSLGQARLVFE